MKANYLANKSEQRRMAYEVAKEEIERQKATVCVNCEKSIGNQVVAVMCKALSVRYGFGKRRLQQIIDDAEDLFSLCGDDLQFGGKRYHATDAVDWLKSIGIDLESDVNEQL